MGYKRHEIRDQLWERLTPREEDIANGLISGMRVKDIAALYGLSSNYVANRIRDMRIRLLQDSKTELVLKLLEMGYPKKSNPTIFETDGKHYEKQGRQA